jgi:hypothetical protein
MTASHVASFNQMESGFPTLLLDERWAEAEATQPSNAE